MCFHEEIRRIGGSSLMWILSVCECQFYSLWAICSCLCTNKIHKNEVSFLSTLKSPENYDKFIANL